MDSETTGDRSRYRVKRVAELTGVTVKTLHHYDNIGLVTPSFRSSKGYRLYTDADLLRLQQVLIHRSMGLPLRSIQAVLDDPEFDLQQMLVTQRDHLNKTRDETTKMLDAVELALSLLKDEYKHEGEHDTMADLFNGFEPEAFQDEAKQSWGESPEFSQAAKRTKKYGPAEWTQIKREANAIFSEAAQLMKKNVEASDERVQELVVEHRTHIHRWFYDCSESMHATLADLYENDQRFAQNIDKHGEGLTAFWCEAVRASGATPRED